MITEFFQTISAWYMAHINYGTITLLMAIESSFIPFPSEIIIPPAAWKAAQGELNVYLVFLFSTFGAMIGAIFNYYVALFFGRKIIYSLANTRLANIMLITPEGVEKAEDYFRKQGKISTFIGRLVPAIRQLISIPAGLSKMKLRDFIVYTMLGAMIWNAILTALGYFLYTQKDILEKYYHELSLAFMVLGLLFVVYLVYKAFSFKKKDSKE
ncbi:MAG: DedA family protein [Bacteroidales bacterium]|nr:DedA family protein [Bacteroidales bacterium]MCB8998919.1 DedA family protein [Bacteroidales bacterium]